MTAEGQQTESVHNGAVKPVGIYLNATPVNSYAFLPRNQRVETQFLDQEAVEGPDNYLLQSVPAGLCYWYIPHGAAYPVPGEVQVQRRKQ